jgi:hypothetical protein
VKPASFNNALVSVVSAYAEALGEASTYVEQLETALRNVPKPDAAVIEAARAVVVAWQAYEPYAHGEVSTPNADALKDAIRALADTVKGS